MRFTKFIAIAFLAVPSFCATVDDIKTDAQNLASTVSLFNSATKAFPTTIGLGTAIALDRVLKASATVVVSLEALILDLNSLEVLIAEDDGRAILDGLQLVGPIYIAALQYIIEKKAVLDVLPAVGGTSALIVVRKDLEGVKTFSDSFKAAMAAVFKDQNQADEWNKLADTVIDKEIATIATLL